MLELLWAVLCRRLIVDERTNLVSYIDAIEGTTFLSLPARIPEISVGLMFQAEVSAERHSVRISIHDPQAKLIAEQILTDVSLATERIRVHVQFGGVPVEAPGRYEFRIFARPTGTPKWKALHRVPFQVAVETPR